MGKLNCWNFKNCGRYPGGPKADEMGICPTTTLNAADGFLGGRAAGRGCAYVTGTFCGGNIQGTHQEKAKNCQKCDYYKALKKQFGRKMGIAEFNAWNRKESGQPQTSATQPWTDPDRTGEVVAQAAQKHYS